jgi:uncharacterized protein DUF6292
LPDRATADPVGVIDELRDYLAEVSAELGVGLESCCWGSEAPAWAYMALDWRLGGRDVALIWDEQDGWAIATEEAARDTDLRVVAHLDGELTPAPSTVAEFVATFRAEVPWSELAAS